jgi:hypothetical protein
LNFARDGLGDLPDAPLTTVEAILPNPEEPKRSLKPEKMIASALPFRMADITQTPRRCRMQLAIRAQKTSLSSLKYTVFSNTEAAYGPALLLGCLP